MDTRLLCLSVPTPLLTCLILRKFDRDLGESISSSSHSLGQAMPVASSLLSTHTDTRTGNILPIDRKKGKHGTQAIHELCALWMYLCYIYIMRMSPFSQFFHYAKFRKSLHFDSIAVKSLAQEQNNLSTIPIMTFVGSVTFTNYLPLTLNLKG